MSPLKPDGCVSIQNQGFNIQKNSGPNLEHAYSLGEDSLKSFYYLLPIDHLFLQMLEMGSLLQQLARQYDSPSIGLFGSLKKIAEFLLDCFPYFPLEAEAFTLPTPSRSVCWIPPESALQAGSYSWTAEHLRKTTFAGRREPFPPENSSPGIPRALLVGG